MRHIDASDIRRFVGVVTSYGIVKECGDSHTGSRIRGDIVGDFVRRITVLPVLTPDGIIRGIVGQFGLVEIHTPSIGIPHSLEFLVMLDKQSVSSNVLTIDFDARERRIDVPTDPAGVSTMIRSP